MQLAPPALCPHTSVAHEAAAWRRYYIQRAAWFDLPTSPHHLIQEDQRGDPWRILVACQVSSRTGASTAKYEVLSGILSAFPSPSTMMSAPRDILAAMLVRVGMQEQRAGALMRMSEGFLGEWQQPLQLFGIGPFGQESVYLFQRGAAAWAAFKTSDTSLSLYLSWARKDLREIARSAGQSEVADDEEGSLEHAEVAPAIRSTSVVTAHTAAQAHLMASVCPPDMKKTSKRRFAAEADAHHAPAISTGRVAEGGKSERLSGHQRPRRTAAATAASDTANQSQLLSACWRGSSLQLHKKQR
jgi:hypothetical protein